MSKARRFGYHCIASGMVAMSALACSSNSDGTTPSGERCGHAGPCEAGWLCVDGVCLEVCNSHRDCAKVEACQSGVCAPVADYACDEDTDCDEPSGCQSVLGAECYAGECHYQLLEAGAFCNDDDACTSNDRCDAAGACSGEALVCDTPPVAFCSQDDSVFREYASTGTCNPAQGSCEYAFEDSACADCRHVCLQLPNAPANLVASAGNGQVTLAWEGVAGASSYNVHTSESAGGAASAVPVRAASSPHVQIGLSNGTTYYFAVSAIGEAGEGDLSPEVSATPRISAPAQVSAVSDEQQVTITWEPVPGAETYHLYWAQDPGVSLSSNVVSDVTSPFVHAPVATGFTYYYALTAVGALSRSELSVEVSAAPRLSAPAQVSAASGDQQVTITWEPVSGADTYDLYWDVSPGVTLESDVVRDVTSPFVHAPLVNSTRYYYALVAVDGPSESELSAEVSATTTIDTATKLVAADAEAYDLFGMSVALSDDYAIVGARGEDDGGSAAGAAYVFHNDGSSWGTGTKLVAPDAEAYGNFGSSVALRSDCAIVGAEDGGITSATYGAAYVFRRTGTNSWDTGTKLVAPDATVRDYFGNAVALYGDYALVGAYQVDAAYVFHYDGSSWDTGTKLVAPDAQAGAAFGVSVALSDDLAIVGAWLEDAGDEADPLTAAGAAYVFRRTGTNSWDAGTRLVAFDAQADDRFGRSLALSGDLVIVGAYLEDGGAGDPLDGAGAAYVFHYDGSSWDAGGKLVAPDAQEGDLFGSSVALSGGYAIVGAFGEGGGDLSESAGAAYVFQYDGASWDMVAKVKAPDAQGGDLFGSSVALSGERAIVGASSEDGGADDPLGNAGAAYIFEL